MAEIDAHPHAEIAGRTINRLNYAWMSLKVRRDTATAAQQLQRVREEDAVNEGRSLNTGFALEVEAILDRLRGSPEESARKLAEAMAIANEFSGDSSPAYRRAEIERMLSLAAAADWAELQKACDASLPAPGKDANPRRGIGLALLALHRSGAIEAGRVLAEQEVNTVSVQAVAYLWFALRDLQEAGVNLPTAKPKA